MQPRPFQVMTKPIGPRCNLDCEYCYYLEKERFYPEEKKFRMPDAVLETYIRDMIAAQVAAGAREVWFAWQGGEPTMLGVEYFRRVVALQAQYAPAGVAISNAFQTNGTLLDDEWAAFFREHGFLVGLSLDGPRALHDRYRVDRAGRPSHGTVMRAARLLLGAGVEVNALCVVHRDNAKKPREVYRYLKKAGFRHIQFIPIAERATEGGDLAGPPGTDPGDEPGAMVTKWSVRPAGYGDFLNAIFDEWLLHDVGRVHVQFFEVQLGLWLGHPPGLCVFAPECGSALALEHNGDLYSCDHYVYPAFRLGNITEEKIEALALSEEQQAFGRAKSATLPGQCRACEFRFACNGGCPKQRFLRTRDGEPGLNYYCDGFQRFFRHAGPWLRIMADLYRNGRPVSEVMAIARARTNRHARRAKP